MRQHKFRAWDKKQKKWLGVNLHLSVVDGCLYWQFAYGCEILSREEAEQIELIQYTGLKDRNGKGIYEGDIVKLSNSTDSTVFGKDVGIVKFMEGRASWCLDTGDFNDWTQLRREIIGNTRENPELIEVIK